MQLCGLAIGKAKFLGEAACPEKLPQGVFTVEVRSVLSLPTRYWGLPVAPQSQFADRLDGMPEGMYQVLGKRFQFYPDIKYRDWLCEMVLGVYLKQIWFEPEKFCHCPFFELFYLPKYDGWIGPKTSQKLVQDFQTWASVINDDEFPTGLYCTLQKAFEIASNSGFVIFEYA